MQGKRQVLLAGLTVATMMVTACRVDTSKQNENGKPNVKVATPFGGVQVKTDDALVEQGLGLPIYPGAEMVGKDSKTEAADVNLSFGKFQLRIKAAHYHTPDAPEKVQAFYKDALKRYGTVIECRNEQPIGTPTTTDEGLTCAGTNGDKPDPNNQLGKLQLKAGSKQHQHVVAIDPQDTGSNFAVLAMDLPGHITVGDEDNRQ